MLADHPVIARMQTLGHLNQSRYIGNDALGNEVYAGDEILEHDNEMFLKEELSIDAIEILEMFGAVSKIA